MVPFLEALVFYASWGLATDLIAFLTLDLIDGKLPGEPIKGLGRKHPRVVIGLFPIVLLAIWLILQYRKWYRRNLRWFLLGSDLIVIGLLVILGACVLVPQLVPWGLYILIPVIIWTAYDAARLVKQEGQDDDGHGRGPDEPQTDPEPEGPRGLIEEVEEWLKQQARKPVTSA